MANVAVYNMEGKEVGSLELNDAVFGVEVNEHLVHLSLIHIFYAIGTAKKAGFVTVGIYDAASEKEQDKIREQADIYLRCV